MASLWNSLERAWDNLAQGWQHLRERAGDAVTRFNPLPESDAGGRLETAGEQTLARAAHWGVLAADVAEDADTVTVRLEVPGMEPDDFDLFVRDDVLVVRGEKRLQQAHSRGHWRVMECAYGSFQRSVPLPAPVEEAGTRARYRRGVLTVTLSKAARARSRRIEVRSA